jgi:hypothetical protein
MTSLSASIETPSEMPETLTCKRSFQVVVESNGIKSVGEEHELDDDKSFPSHFETLTFPSAPNLPIVPISHFKVDDLITHTNHNQKCNNKEQPPPYSPTPPTSNNLPFKPNFDL